MTDRMTPEEEAQVRELGRDGVWLPLGIERCEHFTFASVVGTIDAERAENKRLRDALKQIADAEMFIDIGTWDGWGVVARMRAYVREILVTEAEWEAKPSDHREGVWGPGAFHPGYGMGVCALDGEAWPCSAIVSPPP